MKYIDILRQKLADHEAKRNAALDKADVLVNAIDGETRSELTADEAVAYRAAMDEAKAEKAVIDELRSAIDEAAVLEQRAQFDSARRAPIPGMTTGGDPTKLSGPISDGEARSRALDMIERSGKFIADAHRESVTQLVQVRGSLGATVARHALLTATDAYERGWSKYMSGNGMFLEEDEKRALAMGKDAGQFHAGLFGGEGRAMTSGTGSSGGYFVPIFIDPTMVITGAGAVNPMRQVSTVKTIGPAFGGWYGATAAQVTAAWTAEGSAAPDNTPTVTQPNIPVYMAEASVIVSYQAFEDVADLAADVLALFGDAKNNLEATAFVTGSGSSQPKGVVTAVGAVTASRVSPTTGGTLGMPDIFVVHRALPARFRNPTTRANRAWLASITVQDKLREVLIGQNSANSAWTDVSGENPPMLSGDAIYEASAMSTSLTTGQDVLLYGDFSRFYIVDRIGFSTEFIPNFFDTSTGRPTAQRGWMSHWRTGSDSVDTNAHRLLRL